MEVFISRGIGVLPLIIGVFIFLTWNINTNSLVAGQLNNDTSVSTQLCKDTVLYGALSWDLHSLCCQKFYGSLEDCEFVCPCMNGARTCNVTSRTCECRDGYKGPFCQTSCKHNKKFGRQCTNRCSCGPDAFCDPVTGICVCTKTEGCKRCKVGRWGSKCNYPCRCGRGYSCNDDTGECICRNETFCEPDDSSSDTNCHCQNGGTCTTFSDQCNCREGWTGSDCSQPCPEGFYGAACRLPCHCGEGGICHPETGFCLCPDLSKRYNCNNRCPTGWFGPKCAYMCFCPEGLTCNQISGNCGCLGGSSSCINFNTVTTKEPNFPGTKFTNKTTVQQPLPDMPSITEPPMDATNEEGSFISNYLLWVVVAIVAILFVIVIFLLVLIVFKRKKVNDVDCRKGIGRVDTNDYEDVEEMNIRRDNTLPPSLELPPIPTTPLGPSSPNASLPPLPIKTTKGEPMVPRRVKSLMSTSRKRQKQPQMRNSFHAHTPSMFSSLSTISTRSTETLTPLPKSIQNLGVTNEMLASESAYEATIKSSLKDSRWSSLPSVPVQNSGSRGVSLTDSENVRISLVVADCDEYEDYADPFSGEDQDETSSSGTKEEQDNLVNEKKTMGQSHSNPLYNGKNVDKNGLLKQRSSPNLAKKISKGGYDSPREQLNSRLRKSASTVEPKLRLSHSLSTRSCNESLRDTKRYSSPVLARKDSEEDDYADPSDSVVSPRARALSDMRRSLHDSNSALSETDGGPTYFTLENSSNKSTPNSSRPQSEVINAGEDSDYDELEEEPIEASAGQSKWHSKPAGDDPRKIQRNRTTFGGTTHQGDPQYFVLDRSRNAYSERARNNNVRKNAFRAPLRATEEDGDYSHLERISFDKGDIVVSDLQNDDYASLRT